MPLIVEDGTGYLDAESYCGTDHVDEYVTNRFGASHTWLTKTQTEKEQLIRVATDYMTSQYRGRWKGVKADRNNSLPWPRFGVVDEDGYAYEYKEIPPALKTATAEICRLYVEGSIALDQTEDERRIKREKIGPLETEYEGGKGRQRIPQIDKILAGLFEEGGGKVVLC